MIMLMAHENIEDLSLFDVMYRVAVNNGDVLDEIVVRRNQIIQLLMPYKTENWDSNDRTSLTSKTVVFKLLNNLNSSLTQSDIVTLRINEESMKLYVNKKVLASQSEYFNTMFTSDFSEKYQNKNEFNVPDISFETLETIVGYFNNSELTITEHNVQDLLFGSRILMIDSILGACLDYFKTVIDIENCIVIKTFADALDLKDLYNSCLNYIVKHFRFVANNPEFMNFSYEEVLFIVRSNDLHAKETQVYDSVMNWVRYNPISRSNYTVELLWYVRFPLMLNINNEFSAFYDLNARRMNTGEIFRTQFRHPQRKGILLITYKPLDCKFYDVTIDHWHTLCVSTDCLCSTLRNVLRLKGTRSYLILDSGNLFCVGGNTTKQSSYIFNPDTQRWVHLKITNYEHIKPYILQIGLNIFVIDIGNDRNRQVTTMEFFNIRDQYWETVPIPITNFHIDYTYVTHARGLIYIISSNKAVYYDPENNIFQDISILPKRIRGAAICTLNNNIYIIGGKYKGQYLNSVYAYCTETKVWVSIADMNCPRAQPGVVVMNNSIHVFGGKYGVNSCTNTFEVYDSHKNEWVTSTVTMNTACYNIDAFGIEKDCEFYKNLFFDPNFYL